MKPFDKHEEAISRRVCELRGQDADEMLSGTLPPDANGYVKLLSVRQPRWLFVAEQVRAVNEILQAATEYAVKVAEAHDAAFFSENPHVDG